MVSPTCTPAAAGGVRYRSVVGQQCRPEHAECLAQLLSRPQRKMSLRHDEKLAQGIPEPLPDRAPLVFAKPGGTYPIAVPPDAATSVGGEIVGTAHAGRASKHL